MMSCIHTTTEPLRQTNTLARASAPALAMYGLEGWNATSCIDSSNFFLWAVISCTHVLLSRFQSLIEQSWPKKERSILMRQRYFQCFVSNDQIARSGIDLLPDSRYKPLGSTAKLDTAFRCATMECINFPARERDKHVSSLSLAIQRFHRQS